MIQLSPAGRSTAFLLILIFSLTCPVNAAPFENYEASPWIKEATYIDKISGKLGFGILNIATGWMAVLFEPYRHENKFTGLVKGSWRAVTNTAGGGLHAVTFPFPFDIPLPDGGIDFDV